jgi:hypothetical protein
VLLPYVHAARPLQFDAQFHRHRTTAVLLENVLSGAAPYADWSFHFGRVVSGDDIAMFRAFERLAPPANPHWTPIKMGRSEYSIGLVTSGAN